MALKTDSIGYLNPEHIQSLIRVTNDSPFFKLLSLVVKDVSVGQSLMEVDIEPKHINPFGSTHGGVYYAAIDTAAYWAVYGEIPEHMGLITLDIMVNNLAPVREGKLIIRGSRIKIGKTICIADATISQPDGRIIAHGISKLVPTKGLQTLDQFIRTTGCRELPPKFLYPAKP